MIDTIVFLPKLTITYDHHLYLLIIKGRSSSLQRTRHLFRLQKSHLPLMITEIYFLGLFTLNRKIHRLDQKTGSCNLEGRKLFNGTLITTRRGLTVNRKK